MLGGGQVNCDQESGTSFRFLIKFLGMREGAKTCVLDAGKLSIRRVCFGLRQRTDWVELHRTLSTLKELLF